ncbi:pur operon repressor [Tepidibacillus infernus]|uniref:Transcriptional regulator n=1 Tax=Tepidibacillus decaturensis TaxID=1413211 RepID=A0A135L791_9BACI|nr:MULTISPECIES: pur operon repressor [Tepidibacillus]KXG44834.1 transcriptional regulator [Tepidibacillus decaturensis]GBF11406.1 pur operon repressor [Tepidibacillus sp. HK-1]
MKKLRRSARIVDLTQQFLHQPNTLISLSYFAERYHSAKSSISEDIDIIDEIFQEEGIGQLLTLAGAAGGVKFIPSIPKEEAKTEMLRICQALSSVERLLPGGYLYMSDILGNPKLLKQLGRMFASAFSNQEIDTIITVETKGIPLAHATASYLNVPVVIVRRDSRVTEGSVVTINYVSGSTKRIQTMSLARRALKEGSNVLVIDDFMKAGGTIKGMIGLLQEFNAHLKGIGVFVESGETEERLIKDYISLARLTEVNEREKLVNVELGNFF